MLQVCCFKGSAIGRVLSSVSTTSKLIIPETTECPSVYLSNRLDAAAACHGFAVIKVVRSGVYVRRVLLLRIKKPLTYAVCWTQA